jgi:hypothetical protein
MREESPSKSTRLTSFDYILIQYLELLVTSSFGAQQSHLQFISDP